MYEAYYHLKEQPFGSTPDPRFLYKSRGHREALAYLAYGIFRKKGFLALIGEVGVGKTTVIRAFVQAFNPCLEVAFVLNTRVTFDELLQFILQDFGCQVTDATKVGMLSTLNHYLIEQFAQNRNPVVMIDEAQNLSPGVLEELRMLSNLETDQQKLLQIVLVGQPELDETLGRPDLRQLRQRITGGILRMKPLQIEEVGAYIQYRLQCAGLITGKLDFTEHAHRAIYEYSAGIPRLINMICERALIRGSIAKATTITEDLVATSAQELMAPPTWGERVWGIN